MSPAKGFLQRNRVNLAVPASHVKYWYPIEAQTQARTKATAGTTEVSFRTSLQFDLQPVVGDLSIHFFQPIQHVVAQMREYKPLTCKLRPAFRQRLVI